MNPEAYIAIKDLLFSRKLVPGQKIIYRDLVEKLGMSRTPIINALIRLEDEGFMVSKKNRGFYVKEASIDEVDQLFDIREKLEGIAIEFALENYHDEDLKVLEDNLNAYKDYSSPIYDTKRSELDTSFHMQIARMGKKQYFTDLIRQFYESIFFKINVIHLSPYIEEFKKEHDKIYNAIKAKDIEEAKRIVRIHTQAGKRLVFENIKS